MKIGLFFTLGVSVELWDKMGILNREKSIYEEMLDLGEIDEVFWFTYGVNDKKYSYKLHPKIKIIEMPSLFKSKIGILLYSFCMPFLQRKYLTKLDLIKTNQMRGSWAAVLSKCLCKKSLVVRTGFTWSIFVNKKRKIKLFSLDRFAEFFEKLAYHYADKIIVSSYKDARYIKERYKLSYRKIKVIGNFVNTEIFKPKNGVKKYSQRIIFVGRLAPQKNLENLIKAMSGLPYILDIYYNQGIKGYLEDLEDLAKNIGARIVFKGRINHNELADIFIKYPLFVLPSFYEGMPKVLLEAMASGIAVLGTDVDGIADIIRHNVNGWLIKNTDPISIKKEILHLMNNEQLRERLAVAAYNFVRDKFSLKKIVKEETKFYFL